MKTPKGYTSLAVALDAVGRETYGNGWLGHKADVLTRMTSRIRYCGPRSFDENELVAKATRALSQRNEILNHMLTKFRGSPPLFDDAVAVWIIADGDGVLHILPPQIWIDDRKAWQMLTSGYVVFNPKTPLWRWSPTGGPVAGHLLVAETSLPGGEQVQAPAASTTGASPDSSPSGIRTNKEESAEGACGVLITQLTKRPGNLTTAFAEAKAKVRHIGILSNKAFKRAWADNAPAEWKRGGRRSKRS